LIDGTIGPIGMCFRLAQLGPGTPAPDGKPLPPGQSGRAAEPVRLTIAETAFLAKVAKAAISAPMRK
jgi:hypothetical protein